MTGLEDVAALTTGGGYDGDGDLAGAPVSGSNGNGPWLARVAETATVGETVAVTVEGWDGGTHRVEAWWESNGASVPQLGDPALAFMDDQGDLWLAAWGNMQPGAAGGGSDAHQAHVQDTPATTWTITHDLGKRPSVTIVDSGGTVLDADVSYPSITQVVVSFVTATSGTAYLN